MKKFNVIYFSDCRGCSEVNGMFSMEGESGKEVFDWIIKIEIDKSNGWIEYVNGMINDEEGSWVEDESKWDEVFFVEGEREGEVFNICMCDEFRDVMVIREDSKYFGKFKEGVSDSDEENINLYYDILEELCK
jgi:hypothetical protein